MLERTGKSMRQCLLVVAFFLVSVTCLGQNTVRFQKTKLKLGAQVLTVEVADKDPQRQRGLMHRQRMAESEGMLFVFDREQTLSFWMKNTFIPLSIGFFDDSKRLVDIQDMSPASSLMQAKFPSYASRKPSKYALEVNQGWFSRHNIGLGTTFKLLTNSKK